jgi:hypothetical protein
MIYLNEVLSRSFHKAAASKRPGINESEYSACRVQIEENSENTWKNRPSRNTGFQGADYQVEYRQPHEGDKIDERAQNLGETARKNSLWFVAFCELHFVPVKYIL